MTTREEVASLLAKTPGVQYSVFVKTLLSRKSFIGALEKLNMDSFDQLLSATTASCNTSARCSTKRERKFSMIYLARWRR